MLADIVCTCTTGNKVVASSGSLSSLAKQIENGTLQPVTCWFYTCGSTLTLVSLVSFLSFLAGKILMSTLPVTPSLLKEEMA